MARKKKSPWNSVDDGVPIGVELIVAGPKLGVYPVFVVMNKVGQDESGTDIAEVVRADNGHNIPENVQADVRVWMYAPTGEFVVD